MTSPAISPPEMSSLELLLSVCIEALGRLRTRETDGGNVDPLRDPVPVANPEDSELGVPREGEVLVQSAFPGSVLVLPVRKPLCHTLR